MSLPVNVRRRILTAGSSAMRRRAWRDHQTWALVVRRPEPAPYVSTKGAIEPRQGWRQEFGPWAFGSTPFTRRHCTPNPDELPVASGRRVICGTPAGASGTPDAIAFAAVYWPANDAAFVTGSVNRLRRRSDHVAALPPEQPPPSPARRRGSRPTSTLAAVPRFDHRRLI